MLPFTGITIASYLFFFFFHYGYAQFIQRWNYAPDAFGNVVPHWRRRIGYPNLEVLQPAFPVYLEYNCAYMPSICQNAIDWDADTTLSRWQGRSGTTIFTYDTKAARKETHPGIGGNKRNRDHRRDRVCPDNNRWRNGRGACPETNQYPVQPGPWPYTALESIQPLANYEIQAIRLPNNPNPQRSNRVYTCDEFPPASFIEGGNGVSGIGPAPPEGVGAAGKTICAPFGSKCAGRKVASEQDWQGSAHSSLKYKLESAIRERYGNGQALLGRALNLHTHSYGIQFHLRLVNNPGNNIAASIHWSKANNQPGTPRVINVRDEFAIKRQQVLEMSFEERLAFGSNLTDQDFANYGYLSDHLTAGNDSHPPTVLTRRFDPQTSAQHYNHDEIVPKLHEKLLKRFASTRELKQAGDISKASALAVQDKVDAAPWNISAADVDESLTQYGLGTQQQPTGDKIDIIGLSEMYIRGQLASQNSTSSSASNGTAQFQKSRPHTSIHAVGLSARQAVEGPIQCGPESPCKDGACCSKLGKCGFKDAHCSPDNCISNCDAKAMCGIDSPGGNTKCGLKLCCSYYGWCGTEDVHCKDPEPLIGKTPCQQGFGSCAITSPPSCGKESGTSTRRKIGYYQGWNGRERACDKVSPKQINTKGLTHLYYAFVFFHPTTFEIMPMNDADIPVYKEFTDLKTNGLQTWVAIGGWSFNDPGATQNAFSNMASTSANRATFIRSLIQFMETYGFQGADIDWEYPSEAKRGGRPDQDADNLVLLMKEMHAAFAGRFGSSLALAPDYWYLRGFKPAEMQDYVDFMGFMSYDLHGPWDTDVKTLGSMIRPQTDITEIDKNLTPLWFDGVKPEKINLGFAYYGRSYKLSNPSCGSMGCSFVPNQGGAPGSCTQFSGILSNREIRQIIQEQNIKPFLNETAMVKYFTYSGDSWIGYDDDETYAMKRAFANDRCLGGIMIWSIDFDAEVGGDPGGDGVGGGDDDLVWVDPKIWHEDNPKVQCFFPCTLVLPPIPATKTTTIDYPLITVVSSSVTKGTLTFPPVTVTEWGLSTLIVPGGSESCSTGTDTTSCTTAAPIQTRITTTPTISTTTTWGTRTWEDDEEHSKHRTQAKFPTPPPPPPGIKIPVITIQHGQPSPTVKKCGFAAFNCPPPPGTKPTDPVIGPKPDPSSDPINPENPEDDPDEDPDDDGDEIPEADFCILLPEQEPEPEPEPTTQATQSTAPTTTEKPTETTQSPPPPPKNKPDFPNDSKPGCYNSGFKADRANLIEAISEGCKSIAGKTYTGPYIASSAPGPSDLQSDKLYLVVTISLEVKKECEWTVDEYDCGQELRKIVDGCNTKGENGKQGGTMDGNCIKWRIDPDLVET